MNDNQIIKFDEDKINKNIIQIVWGIYLIGCLFYGVSMLIQQKPILFILKNIGIFLSINGTLNLSATIFYKLLKKFKLFLKYYITTVFSLIVPVYSYITLETNHETWVLSYIVLVFVILHMDIGLIIYTTILMFIFNTGLLYFFRDTLIKEFFNPKSEILIRFVTLIFISGIAIYITNVIKNILNLSLTKEQEILEEKEQALKILSVVRELSDSIKNLGDKNSTISKRLTAASESQASSVEQISASTEQLMASIEEISKNASAASEDMNKIVNEVQIGMNSLKGSTQEMVELVKFSRMMIESIESINEIAENTNLLALNAAIEAARAGESGKGFAVVATEIRKLAEKSTLAAQNVGDLLKESRIKINNGANLNNKVNEIFTNISIKLENISKVFQQISFATQELDKGGKEISNGLEVINQASTENLELSKEIESLNYQLEKDSKKLNQVIKSNRKVGLDLVESDKKLVKKVVIE